MKFSVVKCVNGNNEIVAEGKETFKAAKVNFFQQCTALENAPDVEDATVTIFDDQLIARKTEHIQKVYAIDIPATPVEPQEQPQGE